MTNDERLEVLAGLLAKVRRAATDRGIFLPRELPPGVFKGRNTGRDRNGTAVSSVVEVERSQGERNGALDVDREVKRDSVPEGRLVGNERAKAEPPRLTAFAETGKGTHAPLALVKAPTEASPVSVTTRSVELDAPAPSAPLIEFSPVFDDEVTSTGDPEEVEAMMLAELAAAEEESAEAPPVEEPVELEPVEEAHADEAEQSPPTAPSRPPPSPPVPEIAPPLEVALLTPVVDDPLRFANSPPPLSPSARLVQPLNSPTSGPTRRSYAPRPSVPLELDIDDLGLSIDLPKPPPAPSMSALERAFAKRPADPAPADAVPASAEPRTPMPATLESKDRVAAAPPPEVQSVGAAEEVIEVGAPTPNDPLRGTAPPSLEEPILASPSMLEQIERGLHDEAIPESQRQKVVEARPVDDVLEGVSEPPPESGPVESQRYASHARESMESQPDDAIAVAPGVEDEPEDGHVEIHVAEPSWASSGARVAAHLPGAEHGFDPDVVEIERDESPTPQPLHDVTAEVRSLGDVDVIERPAIPEVEVTIFRGDVRRPISSFGELLERALDLGGE